MADDADDVYGGEGLGHHGNEFEADGHEGAGLEIGRASFRERVVRAVDSSVVHPALRKKIKDSRH